MAKIALNFISVGPAVLKKSVRHRLYFLWVGGACVCYWEVTFACLLYIIMCVSKKEDFEDVKKWVERGEMGHYLCCTTLFLNIYIAVFRQKMPLNGKKRMIFIKMQIVDNHIFNKMNC